MQKYVECIRQSATDYEGIMKEATLDALKFLDITEKNYELSFLEARADPQLMAKLQKAEEEVRLAVDPKRDTVESKDEVKRMLMSKIKMDFESEMKMAGVQVSSQQEAQQRMMIERTQVMDTLYLKYKLKLSDLMRAVQHYDLEEDPDVKALRNSNNAVKMKAKQKMEDAMKLTPE